MVVIQFTLLQTETRHKNPHYVCPVTQHRFEPVTLSNHNTAQRPGLKTSKPIAINTSLTGPVLWGRTSLNLHSFTLEQVRSVNRYISSVGYATTNVIGSRTSFATASVRSSIHCTASFRSGMHCTASFRSSMHCAASFRSSMHCHCTVHHRFVLACIVQHLFVLAYIFLL
jgi:hypothetical protein